ncbi:MAG: hypothetical protein COA58_01510 [Bacteroidetes bacterium]|nr:MAG: hypothetical protein COA58_01510 [Bacteroidota bacterium]
MEIFTCSIFPHLTRIWYDYTRLVLGDDIPITIYDCSRALEQTWFEGATIKKFKNIEHGLKIDHFIENAKCKLVLVTDDDAFIRDTSLVGNIENAMNKNDRLAIFSCHERDHWRYELNEQLVHPIGTYTFAVNTEIIRKENLSLRSVPTNEKWVNSGKGYWDTANYTQFQLLKKEYEIKSIPLSIDSPVSTLFGTSSGFIGWYKKSFFSKSFKLKGNRKKLIAQLPKDKYLFERTLGFVAILDLYKYIYNEMSLEFPLTWNELLSLGDHFIEEDERILQRIDSVLSLLRKTLVK